MIKTLATLLQSIIIILATLSTIWLDTNFLHVGNLLPKEYSLLNLVPLTSVGIVLYILYMYPLSKITIFVFNKLEKQLN